MSSVKKGIDYNKTFGYLTISDKIVELTKMENRIFNVLLEADTPLSIKEIGERIPNWYEKYYGAVPAHVCRINKKCNNAIFIENRHNFGYYIDKIIKQKITVKEK